MNILQSLVKEELDKRHLSFRAAAREIGVSHTTLIRILAGERSDASTLQKFARWLNANPASLVDTLDSRPTELSTAIAAIIAAEPKLAEVFLEASRRLGSGKMSPAELRELVYYAAFRFNIGEIDASEQGLVQKGRSNSSA